MGFVLFGALLKRTNNDHKWVADRLYPTTLCVWSY